MNASYFGLCARMNASYFGLCARIHHATCMVSLFVKCVLVKEALRPKAPQSKRLSSMSIDVLRGGICSRAYSFFRCMCPNSVIQNNMSERRTLSTVFLTFSVLCLQNNLSELYTLFNVAVPGLLGPAAQFRRTYEGYVASINAAALSNCCCLFECT